jgi:hypothetical protein
MQALSDPIPCHLTCPVCHASQLRICGELMLGHPYQQLLVACLECERVFAYTKLTTGVPLIEKPRVN